MAMVDLFWSTKIGFWASLIPGIIVLILLAAFGWVSGLILVLLAAIWVIMLAVIFNAVARKKFSEIHKLLCDCDLDNYMACCQKLLRMRTQKPIEAMMKLNVSNAYLISGHSADAIRMLESITADYFPRRLEGLCIEAANMPCYYNILLAYYLQINDIAAASSILAKFEAALQNRRLRKTDMSLYTGLYMQKQFLLNMANGNYSECEHFFENVYAAANTTLEKVFAKYVLGRIYLHHSKAAQAKEAFEYAMAHGGSTIYRKEAIEYLSALNAKTN